MVSFKYRQSPSWPKGSNRTIKTEVVNILGPWFPKHEIEACLRLQWGFVKCSLSTSMFLEKWVVQPIQNINLSCLTNWYDPNWVKRTRCNPFLYTWWFILTYRVQRHLLAVCQLLYFGTYSNCIDRAFVRHFYISWLFFNLVFQKEFNQKYKTNVHLKCDDRFVHDFTCVQGVKHFVSKRIKLKVQIKR